MESIVQERGRILKRIICDVVVLGTGGIILLLFRFVAKPFHRGFFCDDESLMHPFKDSTVTSGMLYGIGFCLTVFLMVIIESIRVYRQKMDETGGERNPDLIIYGKNAVFARNLYSSLVPFIFGAVIEHITTDIGKYCVGRLRPHFFSVCNLNMTAVPCNRGYVEDFVCQGDYDRIREVRLSFPSGHASFSSYVAMYLMLYLQKRVHLKISTLIRPFMQAAALYLALFTCLSRISDYKHHWSDVLGGVIIGVSTAVLVAVCVSDLFKTKSQTPSIKKRSSYSSMSHRHNVPIETGNNTHSMAEEYPRGIITSM